jgi:hypothetical protein
VRSNPSPLVGMIGTVETCLPHPGLLHICIPCVGRCHGVGARRPIGSRGLSLGGGFADYHSGQQNIVYVSRVLRAWPVGFDGTTRMHVWRTLRRLKKTRLPFSFLPHATGAHAPRRSSGIARLQSQRGRSLPPHTPHPPQPKCQTHPRPMPHTHVNDGPAHVCPTASPSAYKSFALQLLHSSCASCASKLHLRHPRLCLVHLRLQRPRLLLARVHPRLCLIQLRLRLIQLAPHRIEGRTVVVSNALLKGVGRCLADCLEQLEV